jgi:murein L,D-transpeptidase YcbB/YkuD
MKAVFPSRAFRPIRAKGTTMESDMGRRVSRVGFASASSAAVALVLAFGATPTVAQRAPDQPSIALPPLPDAPVEIEKPSATEAPAIVHAPAVSTSIAATPVPSAPDDSQLRAALAARVDLVRKERAIRGPQSAGARQRDAVAAFYEARAFQPLWIDGAGWSTAARGAMARLKVAAEDGLDLVATPLPAAVGAGAEAMAAADLALSLAVVNYGWQASGGRVDPRAIAKLITEAPKVAEPAAILTEVSAATDADAALHAFNPPQPGYAALRAKLAELRRDRPAAPERIAPGPTLKIGMKDARVPLLRARLATSAPEGADDLVYDAALADAVAAHQRANGLAPTGQLTPRVVATLNGADPAALEGEIIANMERWRWEPRAQTRDQIEVNIPDFTVKVTFDGVVAHRARVIVGKPDKPTPVFSNRMQFIEVNPYWNVPESIIKNEMMPKLAADPTYLERMGYEVSTSRSGKLIVRQPPGERNALGRIKFMFPNEHAVYLHDTPTRGLFNTERRAFSHGCVRVDQPFKFAEIVLGANNGWTEDRVKRLIGGKNQTIPLPRQIDIHIEYFTAFVDDDGKLRTREDIYGYSRKVRAALGLTG